MKNVLFQQNEDSGDVNEAEKGLSEFVITCSDSAELLDLLPERFNQMALLVFPPVAFALYLVGFSAGNVWYGAERLQPIHKLLAVIAFISVDNAAAYRQGTKERRRIADISIVSG